MPLSTSLISSPGFINIAITYLDYCTTRSARDTGRHLPSFWLAYVLLSHWAFKLLSGLRIPFTVYLRISEQHRSTCLFCSVFPDVCLSPLRDSVIHTTLIKKKKKKGRTRCFFFSPAPIVVPERYDPWTYDWIHVGMELMSSEAAARRHCSDWRGGVTLQLTDE